MEGLSDFETTVFSHAKHILPLERRLYFLKQYLDEDRLQEIFGIHGTVIAKYSISKIYKKNLPKIQQIFESIYSPATLKKETSITH